MNNSTEFDNRASMVESGTATTEAAHPPQKEACSATEAKISEVTSQELLDRLLSIAQQHRKEGNIQRAKELFWTLVEEHQQTPQADMARAELSALTEGLTSAAAGQPLLERLLTMAQRYCKEGNYRQATEMFWTLVEEHGATPQADAAQAELLALAEGYERAGKQHMARGMYERLLNLEN